MRIAGVQCVICDASQRGVPLTQEQLNQYNASKEGGRSVSLVRVDDDVKMGEEKFSLGRSLAGFVGKAMGFIKDDTTKTLPSVKEAKAKKRGRLFEQIDIGSMNDVDEALNRAKEQGK